MKKATGLRPFERTFRAMGTEVKLLLWNDNEQRAQAALTAAERLFAQNEARLSRFRADSELSRMNAAAGKPFAASPLLFDLVQSALAWRERTHGIFDPAVLNALVAHGYDRTFSAVLERQGVDAPPKLVQKPAPIDLASIDSAGIVLGPGRQITLPAGVGIDLGGIAKGSTIQQAADRLGMWGACLVDAGGDIACTGAPPEEPRVVSVADPHDDEEDIAVTPLRNAVIATSTRMKRRWQQGDKPAHHLIDPRTGAPAATNIVSVSVIAPRLPDAEIHAKTALILGEAEGLTYLNSLPGVAALLVTEDRRTLTTGEFEKKAYVSSGTFTNRFRIAV